MGGVVSKSSTLMSSNTDHKDGHSYWADFVNEPFAEGVSRYAFRGTYHGSGPRNDTNCVTKVFKKGYAKHFSEWVPDLAASKKAAMFADKFRDKELSRLGVRGAQVEFLIPLIARVDTAANSWFLWLKWYTKYLMPKDYVALEPYLPGEYVKFNSNGGYEDRSLSAIMLAFSHWTWCISGHRYMVCDLQGVKYGEQYSLTDPVVHSYDQCFGDTDLGMVGMERVLAQHECNPFCQQLRLDNPLRFVTLPRGQQQRSTTYSFHLTEEEQMRNARQHSDYFMLQSCDLGMAF